MGKKKREIKFVCGDKNNPFEINLPINCGLELIKVYVLRP